MKETRQRSIVKAITYRSAATIATFSLAYIFTGNLKIATSIGLLDFILKLLIYYIMERAWTFTSWGYQKEKKNVLTVKEEKHVKNSHRA